MCTPGWPWVSACSPWVFICENWDWTVRIWFLFFTLSLVLSRFHPFLFRGRNSLCGTSSHPGGLAPRWRNNIPFAISFSIDVRAIAAGVDSKSPLTGGRTSLNGPLNQAQNYPLERCHLHLERFEWNTFSTCCRESLYLPHPSYLITSPFHKWGRWSTERLNHFPRIAQAALADLGFTLRNPGSRVHVQNSFPLCCFTTWRWNG